MPRRIATFLVLAVIFSALFIRLGFWQLSRLNQRRARNALVMRRLAQPDVSLGSLPSDSTSRLRRAEITGVPDFAHEIILAARSYQGSPGVYLFTPLRVPGRDTAILVNRGWVYAPDGVTVDLSKWQEHTTHFDGFAELLPDGNKSSAAGVLRRDARIVRELDYAAVTSLLPYPVSPVYLVATAQDSTTPAAQRVERLSTPALDEGPHLSYAIQWFAFAAIALVGGGVVAVRNRTL